MNTAQLLESLSKEVDFEAESIVLVSRSVKDNLVGDFQFDEISRMKVKGRRNAIEVYRLADGVNTTSFP